LNKISNQRTNSKKGKEIRNRILSIEKCSDVADLAVIRRLLERLAFVTMDRIVMDQRRPAAVVTADNDLIPQEITVLSTVFVCDEEAQTKIDLPPDLTKRWEEMERIQSKITEELKECSVEIGMEQLAHKIEGTYVTVAYNWREELI
jgi:hypothetical protein